MTAFDDPTGECVTQEARSGAAACRLVTWPDRRQAVSGRLSHAWRASGVVWAQGEAAEVCNHHDGL